MHDDTDHHDRPQLRLVGIEDDASSSGKTSGASDAPATPTLKSKSTPESASEPKRDAPSGDPSSTPASPHTRSSSELERYLRAVDPPRIEVMHQSASALRPHRSRSIDATSQPSARSAIISENRAAVINPSLDPTDPRWLLAARATSRLEGPLLTPESRAQLLRTAQRLRLQPFDANMILAIVQERARRGESITDAAPLIELIPPPTDRERDELGAIITRIALALVSALMLALIIIRWITGS